MRHIEIKDYMQEPLRKALKKPDFREEFWSDYKNNDFLFIARKYCKYRPLEDLKWKIKRYLKWNLRRY
jgi:hypothetical protein